MSAEKKITYDDVRFVRMRFSEASYLNRRIISLNLQIEYVENRMAGVSSPRTDEPMKHGSPTSSPPFLELMMEEERLVGERTAYQNQLTEFEWVMMALDDDTRRYATEMYILGERHEKVAERHHYTRQGLYDRINRGIRKVLQCKHD